MNWEVPYCNRAETGMDLSTLQATHDREKQVEKPQQLDEDFYEQVGVYLAQLRADRDRAAEQVNNPYSDPKVQHLNDELQTAKQTVEVLYQKRMGKIMKAASFVAADLPAETGGLTAEEQQLLESVVANIRENRQRVFEHFENPVSDMRSTGESEATEEGTTLTPPSSTSHSGADERDTQPRESDIEAEGPAMEANSQTSETPSPKPESEEPNTGSAEAEPNSDSNPPEDGQSAEEVRTQSEGGNDKERDVESEAQAIAGKPPREGSSGTTSTPQTDDSGSDGPVDLTDWMDSEPSEGEPDRIVEPAEDIAVDEWTTVQVEEDVPPFLGIDEQEYNLQPGETVRLPEPNARVLTENGVAVEDKQPDTDSETKQSAAEMM